MSSSSELACVYAALILADDDAEVSVSRTFFPSSFFFFSPSYHAVPTQDCTFVHVFGRSLCMWVGRFAAPWYLSEAIPHTYSAVYLVKLLKKCARGCGGEGFLKKEKKVKHSQAHENARYVSESC